MRLRRNELIPRSIPITERISIALTPARACRLADFELRTGMKIEQAILDFLDDQIFAEPSAHADTADASRRADISSTSSVSKDRPSAVADKPSHGGSNE